MNTKAKKTGALTFVLVLILVGVVGTLVACNNTSNTLFESGTLGISLKIPKNWEGKYISEEKNKDIFIYHTGTREKYGEGTGCLFYIERLEGILSQEQIEEPGNRFMVLQANGYTYVFGRPTDVQYPAREGGDKTLVDDYLNLAKDLEKIRESIKIVNPITRSGPPAKVLGSAVVTHDVDLLSDLQGTSTIVKLRKMTLYT